MIFIDANIPMYLVGAEHPNKAITTDLVERAVIEGHKLVTDAEVLQELLHRYTAIGRRGAIEAAFDTLLGLVDEVLPIDRAVVERARAILADNDSASARDAVHVAVMRTHGVDRVMSFDRGFDRFDGIQRLPG
jgi:predicted nucleic acid-binding protein